LTEYPLGIELDNSLPSLNSVYNASLWATQIVKGTRVSS